MAVMRDPQGWEMVPEQEILYIFVKVSTTCWVTTMELPYSSVWPLCSALDWHKGSFCI